MSKVLAEYEAEKFLKRYVPVAKGVLVKKEQHVAKACKFLGYPVVLKIISKAALHKTDIKGVRICSSLEEAAKAYRDLLAISRRRKLEIEGILFQEFVKGREAIIGLKKDDVFGHVIMLGTGGIAVELLKDVSFRVCPITERNAQAMIDELKLSKLLHDYRGEKVNTAMLVKALVKISKIPGQSDYRFYPFI